jgi:hypothetical protein
VAGRIDPAWGPARLAGHSGEFQMREGYGTG